MTKKILAWHLIPKDRRLEHGDDRIVRARRTMRVEGPPSLCNHGLHASEKLLDALGYHPGPIICRVKVGGAVVRGDDKLAATERRCLWWVDGERIMHEFAVWCARRALKTANVTDQRCWEALRVKLHWLKGKATDEELAAARDAAGAAAWDAARDAAWDAAGAAAWDAARAAAGAAAGAAERQWQTARLMEYLYQA